jgi:ribosomal protein S18 acetylase RimI-like enzyme
MTLLSLLPSPVAPLVIDHRCRRRSITNSSHQVLHRTRALASTTSWNIEISRGLLPQTSLSDVADLLAAAFRDDSDDDNNDNNNVLENTAYKLRLMAALQFRGLTEGRQFITVLARSRSTGNTAGVVTLAPGLGPADAEGHFLKEENKETKEEVKQSEKQQLLLQDGQTIGSISNMAVEEHSRRRGLGKILLETAEVAAGSWPVPPSLFALCVYRTNEAAIELYRKSGYIVDESWIDPKWLHAAERGLATGCRRSLMIKKIASWETESEDDWN